MEKLSALWILMIFFAPGSSAADSQPTHKCVTSGGEVSYQESACSGKQREQEIKATVNSYAPGPSTIPRGKALHKSRPGKRLVTKKSPGEAHGAKRKTPESEKRDHCRAVELVLAQLLRSKYNNPPGGLSAKLKARAAAIRQKMIHCQ